jgi:uncharacterized membrane protein YeaQ/YmgE (transglycosylase-associated protein family)
MQALLTWAVVGLAAGWLASLFLGGKGFVRYIVVGMVGSIVGGYLFAALGISLPIDNTWVKDIITAAAGAAIVIIIARIIA